MRNNARRARSRRASFLRDMSAPMLSEPHFARGNDMARDFGLCLLDIQKGDRMPKEPFQGFSDTRPVLI